MINGSRIAKSPHGSRVAGTLVLAVMSMGMAHVPIEDLRVGDRVHTPTTCEVFEEDHPVRIDVDVTNDDGHVFGLSLLRSAAWVASNVHDDVIDRFELPELSIAGPGVVSGISEINIPEGSGCVVTMTVQHDNRSVRQLLLSGEAITTTDTHPFWS